MKNWLPAELGRWLRAMEITALDAVAGAAHAGALRVAALNHKAGDDAVENGAVVKAALDQVNEVVHRVGGHLGIELHFQGALGGLDGYNGILHWIYLPKECCEAGRARLACLRYPSIAQFPREWGRFHKKFSK